MSASSPGSQPHDHLGFELPKARRIDKRRLFIVAAIVLAILTAAFVAGWLPRHETRKTLEAEAHDRANAVLRVEVVTPKPAAADVKVVLPGTIEPLEETTIYPRVDGYVRSWLVDLGDRVTEGDLLAEIDTPELDQELAAAKADLAQAEAAIVQSRATQVFSESAAERAGALTKEGLTSQQELEQRQATAESAKAGVGVAAATIASRRANIRRLTDLKAFARVVAPFSGTIVSRTLTRGTLVSSGPSTPLFKIVATDPVRVMVAVPQDVAPSIATEMAAELRVREFGDEAFPGIIARSSNALDQATRTMLVEVRVPNADGRLLTGMSAKSRSRCPCPTRP